VGFLAEIDRMEAEARGDARADRQARLSPGAKNILLWLATGGFIAERGGYGGSRFYMCDSCLNRERAEPEVLLAPECVSELQELGLIIPMGPGVWGLANG
jgi:hypothetical protein